VGLHLNGITSTSRNLEIALTSSQCTTSYGDDLEPVLYIYSITNYDGFRGFRVNEPNYSAFPHEQEYLLCEGFKVTVLGSEEDF